MDHPEAERLGPATAQLGIGDDEAQPVLGHGEPANGVDGLRATVTARLRVAVTAGLRLAMGGGGARPRLVAIRTHRAAGQGTAAEQDGERSGEAREPPRGAHAATS